MCYRIIVLSLIFGTFLFTPTMPDFPTGVAGYGRGWQSLSMVPDLPGICTVAAVQAQTTVPGDKQSAPDRENAEPAQDKQEEKPGQQRDKKKPPQDFQPTEKIDADKAVDFPADI